MVEEKISYINQYIVAFCGNLLIASVFTTIGWASPTLPKLLADDSPLPITTDESSWIVSFDSLGSIFGPVFSALIVDRIGRKITLLVSVIPLSVAWILIIVADDVLYLYISRLLSGIGCGVILATMPMYLGEISSDAIRGSTGSLTAIMAKVGILLSFSIGPFVSVKTLASILLAVVLTSAGTFLCLPESPYFFSIRNKKERAIKSLTWLGGHKDVNQEYVKIEDAVYKANENKGTLKQLFAKGNLRSLMIIVCVGSSKHFSGAFAILSYASQIFRKIDGGMTPSVTAIILGVVQLISSTISYFIIDRYGRRPLLLISSIGVTACNFIVATYLYYQTKMDVSEISWIAISSIMIHLVFFAMGLSPVTFTLLGEIFPTNIKAIAIASYSIFESALTFFIGKIFQVINDSLGTHVSFYSFGCISLALLVSMWCIVPETKQKSLDTILEEMKFSKTKKNFME